MPGIGGIEPLERLRAAVPSCKVVVLTSSESAEHADRALAAGAHGYLTKTVPFPEIVATIREIHVGGAGICKGVPRAAANAGPPPLSPREHSVLLLLRRGLSNPEIGRALGITDRTGAVARAFDLGLLRAEHSGQ